jgi:hypothetical protein
MEPDRGAELVRAGEDRLEARVVERQAGHGGR